MTKHTITSLFVIWAFLLASCTQADGRNGAAKSADETTATAAETASNESPVEWIRSNAISLNSVTPGGSFDDLRAIGPAMDELRVIGLGEATHGTREFFQFKHRMLQFLVEEHGYRVFGIEANFVDCIPINDFVTTGEGDPEALVHGMNFWTWDTEEVLDLVLWMRDYNLKNDKKIYFHGYDAQFAPPALRYALDALARADSEKAAYFEEHLSAYLRETFVYEEYSLQIFNESDALKTARHDLSIELLETFDANVERYSRELGDRDFRFARAAAFNAERAFAAYRPLEGEEPAAAQIRAFNSRDRAMADLTLWGLENYEPGLKAVLWAHNGHVQNTGFPWAGGKAAVMGMNLKEDLGAEYASLGFGFGEGGLQARGMGQGESYAEDLQPLQAFVVGPAPGHTVGGVMTAAVGGDFLLDLTRLIPDTPAWEWFMSPQPMRAGGGVFVDAPVEEWGKISIGKAFDYFVFIEKTTRARPLERTRVRFGLEKTW